MRQLEYYAWSFALLLSPWLAYGALVAGIGQPGAGRFLFVTIVVFLIVLRLASRRTLQWRLAYLSRVPVVALRRQATRRWRWLYRIEENPVRLGTHAIWVSRVLTMDQRARLIRVREALSSLALVQPSRAARLTRLGVAFAVTPLPATAIYLTSANVLALDPSALDEPAEVLAGLMVRESIHARLDAYRLMHPMLEQRTKRLATKDQLLFATRLNQLGKTLEALRLQEFAVASFRADSSLRARWQSIVSNEERIAKATLRDDA